MDKAVLRKILLAQKSEKTDYLIYKKILPFVKDAANRKVLEEISQQELKHYGFLKEITRQDAAADKFKVRLYVFLARIFGLAFSLKLMERGENLGVEYYRQIKDVVPQAEEIIQDENRHEREVLSLRDEDKLKYVGSVVLGLNNALVEMTDALVSLITSIAGSMSMAASENLSTKQKDTGKTPFKAAVYTGIAYIFTVLFLIIRCFLRLTSFRA